MCRPVSRATLRARYSSGRKITDCSPSDSITLAALLDVQQMSVSAFDVGVAVDVGDDRDSGVAALQFADVLGGNARGERTARLVGRDENVLVRAEDFGRLGHELDAAKDDGVGVGLGGAPA